MKSYTAVLSKSFPDPTPTIEFPVNRDALKLVFRVSGSMKSVRDPRSRPFLTSLRIFCLFQAIIALHGICAGPVE